MDNRLLTVAELAERLAISEWQTRKYCRDGYLPAFKLGADYRMDPNDLDTFLASLKSSKAGAAS